jgi:hypothetical protein
MNFERRDIDDDLLLIPSMDKDFELKLIDFEHEGIARGLLNFSGKVDWKLKKNLKFDNLKLRILAWCQGPAVYTLHHRQWWSL